MSKLLDVEQQNSFVYLKEVETTAQDILTLKQEKIELANAQNKCREALRALETTFDRNTWMKIGSVYIERPTEECKAILRKGNKCECFKLLFLLYSICLEISKAEDDLASLHNDIKNKVHKLRDLEHEPRLEGFSLKPISMAEAKGLHKAFGGS